MSSGSSLKRLAWTENLLGEVADDVLRVRELAYGHAGPIALSTSCMMCWPSTHSPTGNAGSRTPGTARSGPRTRGALRVAVAVDGDDRIDRVCHEPGVLAGQRAPDVRASALSLRAISSLAASRTTAPCWFSFRVTLPRVAASNLVRVSPTHSRRPAGEWVFGTSECPRHRTSPSGARSLSPLDVRADRDAQGDT